MKNLTRLFQGGIRYLTARFVLRKCRIGRIVTVRGLPRIDANGTISIGDKVSIWSHIHTTQLSAGNNALLEIGGGTFINTGSVISARKHVKIGRNCQIANQVILMDDDFHGLTDRDKAPTPEPIIIEDDVWLATRCTVLKGVRIGKGAVVAAGAVVTHDVAPYTLVGGVPAKFIKSLK
ncbi:MAG: acyltransferase [Spirosomataceae bacterium]